MILFFNVYTNCFFQIKNSKKSPKQEVFFCSKKCRSDKKKLDHFSASPVNG